MEFTVNTKPLKSAMAMLLVSGNVTNANPRSSIVELTASKDTLKLNTQSTGIKSEVRLIGNGTDDSTEKFIANIGLFKSLINSLNATQTTLCFEENCLQIKSGKTTLSVKKDDNISGMSLMTPTIPDIDAIEAADAVDVADWKFVKEHQAYALSRITKPSAVYTYFFFTEDGEVIAGDYVHSLFSKSECGQLDKNCLVSPFIINLMATMPAEAKFVCKDDNYVVVVKNDSFDYYAQVEVVADAETIEAYPHEAILSLLGDTETKGINFEIEELKAVLNQASLLSSTLEPEISIDLSKNVIHIKDTNVESSIIGEGEVSDPCTLAFDLVVLKSIVDKCSDNKITIFPSISDDEVSGIVIVGESAVTVLGCKADDVDVS